MGTNYMRLWLSRWPARVDLKLADLVMCEQICIKQLKASTKYKPSVKLLEKFACLLISDHHQEGVPAKC